jgi:hypothetical protein
VDGLVSLDAFTPETGKSGHDGAISLCQPIFDDGADYPVQARLWDRDRIPRTVIIGEPHALSPIERQPFRGRCIPGKVVLLHPPPLPTDSTTRRRTRSAFPRTVTKV